MCKPKKRRSEGEEGIEVIIKTRKRRNKRKEQKHKEGQTHQKQHQYTAIAISIRKTKIVEWKHNKKFGGDFGHLYRKIHQTRI